MIHNTDGGGGGWDGNLIHIGEWLPAALHLHMMHIFITRNKNYIFLIWMISFVPFSCSQIELLVVVATSRSSTTTTVRSYHDYAARNSTILLLLVLATTTSSSSSSITSEVLV